MAREHICTLVDGRRLSFREYGNLEGGFPVIFLHGNLNSRLFDPSWGETQKQTGAADVRVIAVDRPGFGLSDFLPDRSYSLFASDVRQLADFLQLKAFAVLGFSSGGPNALACAMDVCSESPKLLPGSLVACGLISSDGPYLQMGLDEHVARTYGTERTPEALRSTAERMAADLRSSYEGMKRPERREVALADLEEALRQGAGAGSAQDMKLESSAWDFEISAIDGALVPVLLWHGTDDKEVPVEVGRYIAEHVKGCVANFIEGEGHSLLRRHWQQILVQLVASARQCMASRL